VGQTERLYKIEQMLRSCGHVSLATFLSELEVFRATFNRDLDLLRDRLNAPITYDAALRGYRVGEPAPGVARHELPGLWFSSRELHTLLAFQPRLTAAQKASGSSLQRRARPIIPVMP